MAAKRKRGTKRKRGGQKPSRAQLPGVLAQKKHSRSKKAMLFATLVAHNLEQGLTPMQAVAAAKNGVKVVG